MTTMGKVDVTWNLGTMTALLHLMLMIYHLMPRTIFLYLDIFIDILNQISSHSTSRFKYDIFLTDKVANHTSPSGPTVVVSSTYNNNTWGPKTLLLHPLTPARGPDAVVFRVSSSGIWPQVVEVNFHGIREMMLNTSLHSVHCQSHLVSEVVAFLGILWITEIDYINQLIQCEKKIKVQFYLPFVWGISSSRPLNSFTKCQQCSKRLHTTCAQLIWRAVTFRFLAGNQY